MYKGHKSPYKAKDYKKEDAISIIRYPLVDDEDSLRSLLASEVGFKDIVVTVYFSKEKTYIALVDLSDTNNETAALRNYEMLFKQFKGRLSDTLGFDVE